MLDVLKKLFSPTGIKCIACHRELANEAKDGLCERCVLPINSPACSHCGRGFVVMHSFNGDKNCAFKAVSILKRRKVRQQYFKLLANSNKDRVSEQSEKQLCVDCCKGVYKFSKAVSPFSYRGRARELILRFKFSNALYLGKYLALFMVNAWKKHGIDVDFVTFVPTTKKRINRRGYNQSLKLAQLVASHLNLKVANIINKNKDVKISKLNRLQRQMAVKNCFSITNGLNLMGKRVLLIDDILTSASTCNECSRKLIEAGASMVFVLTFASAKTFFNLNQNMHVKNID